MYKKIILISFLGMTFFGGQIMAVKRVKKLRHFTKQLKKNDLVIAYFHRFSDAMKNNPPKKKMQKNIAKKYERAEDKYQDYVTFLSVNVARRQELEKLARDIKVTSFPSFALILYGQMHAYYPVQESEITTRRIIEFIDKYFGDKIKEQKKQEREREKQNRSGVRLHIHSGYPTYYYDYPYYYPSWQYRRCFRRHHFGYPYRRRIRRRGHSLRMRGRSPRNTRRSRGGSRRWGKE